MEFHLRNQNLQHLLHYGAQDIFPYIWRSTSNLFYQRSTCNLFVFWLKSKLHRKLNHDFIFSFNSFLFSGYGIVTGNTVIGLHFYLPMVVILSHLLLTRIILYRNFGRKSNKIVFTSSLYSKFHHVICFSFFLFWGPNDNKIALNKFITFVTHIILNINLMLGIVDVVLKNIDIIEGRCVNFCIQRFLSFWVSDRC